MHTVISWWRCYPNLCRQTTVYFCNQPQSHYIHIYISVFLSTNIFVSSNGRIQSDLMKYKHSQLHSTRGPFLNNKIVWKSTAWRTIGLAETLMKWQSLILSYWEHKAFCFRIVQRKMLCNNAQHTTGYCSVKFLIFIAADVNSFDDNQCTRTRCWETLKKVDFTLQWTTDYQQRVGNVANIRAACH